jgi:hypothetical protein
VHSVLGIQNRGFGTIDEQDQANKISATGKPAYKKKISTSKGSGSLVIKKVIL